MILDSLTSQELVDGASLFSTGSTLRDYLRTRPEVASVASALRTGLIGSLTLQVWVRGHLGELRPGQRFPHECAFAALAVALERVPHVVAQEYLTDLASLEIAEMPLASRVARWSLEARRESVANNIVVQRTFHHAEAAGTYVAFFTEPRVHRSSVESTVSSSLVEA